jgi:multicomponent Na+:H+ antiporter subunit D
MFTEPLDALLIFTVSMPVIGWVAHKKRVRPIQAVYAALALSFAAYFLFRLYEDVAEKGVILIVGQVPFNPLVEACLRIDTLSVFMAFLYAIIGLFATVYSFRYMERDTGLSEYYTLLLGMIAGMTGVVFAGDFFTLFVFWEFMCLTSYTLVAFRKQKWEPIEAGFKYLIMSATGSATILLAMSFLYGMCGTLNFATLAVWLSEATPDMWLYMTLALIIAGFGIKAAIVPFHTWLPDAHPAAPAPVSALLSGVLVQTGAYGLIRVLLTVFGSMQGVWQATLAIFAVFTMFIGNFLALLQYDIKRLLAYSTIAQMGYILFGIATGLHQGLTGSFFHTMNHALMKSLLFLSAGGLIYRTGTRDLRELQGIRRAMPITSMSLAVGAVAIAAIPPLNGFWSEWLIVLAGLEAGMFPFSALMVINMLLSVAYYLRLIYILVLKEPTPVSAKATEAPASMLIPIMILAVLCIIIGIYPGPFVAFSQEAAQAALGM